MATQSDPEKLPRLNWRERLQEWRRRPPSKSSGNATESQHGVRGGQQDGLQVGEHDGPHVGRQHGFHDGGGDGQHPGRNDGVHDGFQASGQLESQSGRDEGNGDEADYGFHIGRIGDTLIDLEPGERRPPDAEAHAQAFLVWLQGGAEVGGNWMRRSLLEKLYAGPFMDIMVDLGGWSPESWQTVARHFRKLSGVKVRQKDLRVGAYREGGPTTALDYWIPRRATNVVAMERKSA